MNTVLTNVSRLHRAPHRRERLLVLCPALLALVACIGALAAPSVAEARRKDKDPVVLILRVEGTTVEDAERRSLTNALARKARKYGHFDVVVSKTDLVEEMFEFECTEAGVDCLSKIGAKYKAKFVVYSEIAGDDKAGYVWSMRVVEMKSDDSPISRVAQSTVQKLDSLSKPKKSAANGLLVLIGPVDLPEKRSVSPGTLHVRLIGGGVALVYVNEKLAGRSSLSGLKVQLQPGKYTVKVVRAGFKDWTQVVTIEAGKTIDRVVELDALPKQKAVVGGKLPKAVPLTSRWYFWAGVATATAAVAVTVWAVTRDTTSTELGNAAFSLDSNDAHLDPVFGGG